MNPQDAQSSLHQIRPFQDKSRQEVVRQMFPWPYAVVSALGLFAMYASIDLELPWRAIASGFGTAVYIGAGCLHQLRVSVCAKPKLQMIGVFIGVTVILFPVFFVVFVVGRIAGFALFGVPAHGLLSQATVGAAAAAVVYIAITPVVRRIITWIALQAFGPTV